MKLLAIDTTLGACSAAFLTTREDGKPEIHQISELMNRGHAEKLMPMIGEIGQAAGIKFSDLDRIAVTTGPGTFTGVRIGVATARGLALGIGCKIFAATSLHVLAKKAMKDLGKRASGKTIYVGVDARRGEIYLQSFNEFGAPLSAANAVTPEDAIKTINGAGAPGIIVGNAMNILEAAGLNTPHILASELQNIEPDAADLAELAALAPVDALEDYVSPLYLRAPDAKPQIGKSIIREINCPDMDLGQT